MMGKCFNTKLGEISDNVKTFEQRIREIKINKLQRDARDYEMKKVYKWLQVPSSSNKKTVHSGGIIS